jgi:hypothetical protein
MLQINRDIRPRSMAAMNSASVVERAIEGWNLVVYAMVLPAIWIHIPLNEHHVLTHVAQSESPYTTAVEASCCGQLSRRRLL